MSRFSRGILVTGGGTFLGDHIASALLASGAKVSLLVRPDSEDKLGPLAQQTRWSTADVWSPASLRGKARNHDAVIHTVGSLSADPAQGLSHSRLNYVSARNIANMCVSDGVERMILISGASAPWISRAYIHAKRDAERYMRRLGLRASIVRAPLLYVPGRKRPFFYRAMSLFGALPPLSWLVLNRIAPMPIDELARGVALLAISGDASRELYYARNLRQLIRRGPARPSRSPEQYMPRGAGSDGPYDNLDEDLPFGWTPGP